jgi:hypothetical protein
MLKRNKKEKLYFVAFTIGASSFKNLLPKLVSGVVNLAVLAMASTLSIV